jgi:very-short-patch-repair endonuclease
MKASKENFFNYNNKLQPFANSLRKTMTKAEACLWKYLLRGEQMKGYGFRRQRPINNFIADFMCKDLMLIIEVDGNTHLYEETFQRDKIKQKKLEELGFTVLRFTDDDILKNLNKISYIINDWIEEFEKKNPKI